MKTNTQLQRDVMDELEFEPSVDASNIGVSAKDGIVTLTGKVSNYAEKYAASEATERVIGVKAVTDELKVDLPSFHKRDDQDIAHAALNALKWDVSVPNDVDQGESSPSAGSHSKEKLITKFQQTAAEDAVQNLTGVTGVSNLISIRSAIAPSDVKLKIENALKRAAELDAEDINVEVDGHKVTLERQRQLLGGARRSRKSGLVGPGRLGCR